MRILLVTDPPMIPGAYGIQGHAFATRLQAAGHVVRCFAPTYIGGLLHYNGVEVLGGVSGDWTGSQMMDRYAQSFEADLLLTLKDAYIYDQADLMRLRTPWLAVTPLDTEPLDLASKGALDLATAVGAVTRAGQASLAEQGLQAVYLPLGIETAFWTPGDRAGARRRLGLDGDVFVAAFVGRNLEWPNRKNLDQIVLTWGAFAEQHRDSVLFLHTSLGDLHGGLNVELLLDRSQLPKLNWRACPQDLYESNTIGPDYLRDLYRAADVLVAVGNEGFCVPAVEAQSCGCPVLGVEFAGLRDTARVGWRIDLRGGETVWHPRGGFWFRPSRRALLAALELAYRARGDEALREQARLGAQRYAFDTVFETYWKPALAALERLLLEGEVAPETEAVPA